MSATRRTRESELHQLRARVAEMEQALDAIRSGEVDALVTDGPHGTKIYTLETADQPYRELIEQLSEGAAALSMQGNLIYCNRRLAEMTGLPQEKLLGFTADRFIPADQRAAFAALLNQSLHGEAKAEMEFERADGTSLPVQISLRTMATGPVSRICMIVTDVAELKEASRAIQAERRRFEAILDSLPAMICLLTPDHRVAFENKSFRHVFGESKGRPCYQYRFDQDDQCSFCQTFQVLKTHSPHQWEIAREGQTFRIFDLPFNDIDGSPLILQMDIDVTEQRKAEAALRELNTQLENKVEERTALLHYRQQRLDLALQSSEEGVWDWNVETGDVWRSPHYNEILGYDQGEIEPTFDAWIQLVHPDDRPIAEKVAAAVLRGESKYEMEVRARRKDAAYIYVLSRGIPLRTSPNSPVLRVVGTLLDLTARKSADRALQERTTQLEAAFAELESFNFAIAHDLRAPLRHIHGFVEMLAHEARPVLNETAQNYLKVICESTERMGKLLEELLNLARYGRQELRRAPCKLNSMVEQIRIDLRPDIANRHIEWRIGDLPVLNCDATLMKQALLNLIANAVKFTRDRTPAVIEIGHFLREGLPVIFVRDNGVGFDMRYAGKLFGLFQRLHPEKDFEGTGIGLAIVQRIIRRHGGSVWADSQPDRGATFCFTLHSCEAESTRVADTAH